MSGEPVPLLAVVRVAGDRCSWGPRLCARPAVLAVHFSDADTYRACALHEAAAWRVIAHRVLHNPPSDRE